VPLGQQGEAERREDFEKVLFSTHAKAMQPTARLVIVVAEMQ